MWVFCGGMKRSGSTLQYQLASALLEQAGLGIRVTWSPADDFPRLREQYARVGLWKVFKSHECTPAIAREITRHDSLGLYIYRDLRDVIASQMHMSRLSFDRLWSLGFLDECLDQDRRWTSLARVGVMKYEDVVADLPRLVQRIGAHLGILLGPADCARVAGDHTIPSQKKRIQRFMQNRSLRRVEAIGNDLLFDPESLLHHNHINTGACRAWTRLLAPAESARVEVKFGDWLRSKGYLDPDG